MAKLPELLRVAIEQTLQLQDVESDAYRAWIRDPAGPFTPSVPAANNSGSYPTTAAAMSALATIADTLLQNDPDFERTTSRDTARMEAARTLGELLPTFAGPTAGKEWLDFRSRLKERLCDRRQSITHYVPVWLFLRQSAPPFSVGPVSFKTRDAWLNEVERRQGKPSAWISIVRDIWSGAITYADLEAASARSGWKRFLPTFVDCIFHRVPASSRSTNARTASQAKTIARTVHPDQWIADVTIEGFEPSESYSRAVLAVRVALDALRLLMPSPHNRKIATAADHGPPLGVDRLSQTNGHDLAHGSSLNLPGVGGAPGMAASLINDNEEFLRAAGRRIDVANAAQLSLFASRCPELSDRWVNAAHWFGRACRVDVDFAALVMLVFSMDVLCGGLENRGITELASRLLGIDQNRQVLPDGTTLVQFVNRGYGYRSEIAHGSILAIDKNFSDERVQVEQLASAMLIRYAVELDKYADALSKDDRDAFCASLPLPKAGS